MLRAIYTSRFFCGIVWSLDPAVGATCPLYAIKLDQLYNYRARKVTRAVIYNGLGVEAASDDACP